MKYRSKKHKEIKDDFAALYKEGETTKDSMFEKLATIHGYSKANIKKIIYSKPK